MLDPRSVPDPVGSREADEAKPRVVVLVRDPAEGLQAALIDEKWTLVPCGDAPALLEAIVAQRPNVIVVAFSRALAGSGLLSLVRRAAPQIPLILLADEGDLELQRMLQHARPYYYDVVPFDPDELHQAVRSALAPSRSRRAIP